MIFQLEEVGVRFHNLQANARAHDRRNVLCTQHILSTISYVVLFLIRMLPAGHFFCSTATGHLLRIEIFCCGTFRVWLLFIFGCFFYHLLFDYYIGMISFQLAVMFY